MFVPGMYRAENEGWLLDVVERYPLASLLTNGPDVPSVTRLPVVFSPEDAVGRRDIVGATLLGHLNRANPQWAALSGGVQAVLVFHGPNSYVTPTLYQTTPASPTWNFVAVHLRGRVQPIDDQETTLEVVKLTAETYETRFGNGWQMDDSLQYFRRIAPAVGAFRFEVTQAEGMFKLSQEKDAEVRQRISEEFATAGSGSRQELGALMLEIATKSRNGG